MEPFIGQIQAFGFNFAPRGWAKCDGQLLPISQNSALFSLLGTIYGGDGRTTFALPDLRGRSMINYGHGLELSDIRIGQTGGTETTTLQATNLPPHNHAVSIPVSNTSGGEGTAPGQYIANHAGGFNEDPTGGQTLGAVNQSTIGSGIPFNNLPPFLGSNICIALVGIYPSRS